MKKFLCIIVVALLIPGLPGCAVNIYGRRKSDVEEIGKLGDEPPDIVIQREPPALGKHKDTGGGKLLGYGGYVEHGGGGDREAVVQAGRAVTTPESDGAILEDRHGAAGASRLELQGYQAVNPDCPGEFELTLSRAVCADSAINILSVRDK